MNVQPSIEDPFLTPAQVASIFQVTDHTVREWLKAGTIKGIKLPTGAWRIQQSEMTRFANERYGSND